MCVSVCVRWKKAIMKKRVDETTHSVSTPLVWTHRRSNTRSTHDVSHLQALTICTIRTLTTNKRMLVASGDRWPVNRRHSRATPNETNVNKAVSGDTNNFFRCERRTGPYIIWIRSDFKMIHIVWQTLVDDGWVSAKSDTNKVNFVAAQLQCRCVCVRYSVNEEKRLFDSGIRLLPERKVWRLGRLTTTRIN